MNREQAYEILHKYMKGERYLQHSYAVEAIMRGLAKKLAPDAVEYWGIAGLLHDLDEEQCDWQNDLSVHGPTSVEILKKEGNVGYAISTIYRILATFEEMHFVEKSNFIGDGTVVYEWNKGSHTHYAICLQCHKKVALQVCPFENLHLHGEAKDFVVTGHKLELYGYCKECEKKKIKKITKN